MTVRRWLDATDKSYFLRINISIFEKQIFKWDPLSEKHDSKKLWCYTFWPNCKGLHDFGPYSWGAIFLDGTNILHYFWRNIYISRAKHIDLRKVYVYVCLCLAINISYLWPHGLFIYIAIRWCKFFLLLINAFSTKGVIKQLQPLSESLCCPTARWPWTVARPRRLSSRYQSTFLGLPWSTEKEQGWKGHLDFLPLYLLAWCP